MTPSRQLEVGALVADRYRVSSILGVGGMGEVYRAEQLNLGREVALKLLKPELSHMTGARARFKREARVAAALRHPGAVEIYDFGEDDGCLYLVMELLPGPTLRHLLKKTGGPFEPLSRSLTVAQQVADVLVAAHSIGLVHRDLKPSNVFLVPADSTTNQDRAVVADFGLAFIEDRDDAGRLTREGVLTGTPAYVSPEQALGRSISAATDVYSLGCTLYEMTTGVPPFCDESEVAVVTKHLFSVPKSPRSLSPPETLPHALEELILRMLAKRPEERPSSSEVSGALRDIISRLGTSERSRGDQQLLSREERMIDEPLLKLVEPTLQAVVGSDQHTTPTTPIVTRGPVEDSVLDGLRANGFDCRNLDDGTSDARAIFAPSASLDALDALCKIDLPIVTDTDPSDMNRLAAALELGVDEVLPRPLRAEEVARRVSRAIRRYRGRRRNH